MRTTGPVTRPEGHAGFCASTQAVPERYCTRRKPSEARTTRAEVPSPVQLIDTPVAWSVRRRASLARTRKSASSLRRTRTGPCGTASSVEPG